MSKMTSEDKSEEKTAQHPQLDTSTFGVKVAQLCQRYTDRSSGDIAQRPQLDISTSGVNVAQLRQRYTDRSGAEEAQRHQPVPSTSGVKVAQLHQPVPSTSGVNVAHIHQCYTDRSGAEVEQGHQPDPSTSGVKVSHVLQHYSDRSGAEVTQCPHLDISRSGADAVPETMQELLDLNTKLQNRVKLLRQMVCDTRKEIKEIEQKHLMAEQTITQLEAEKADLKTEAETLTVTMKDMRDRLVQSDTDKDNLVNECDRERRAHSILRSEYDDLKKTLMEKEEIINNQSDLKHQKAEETIGQLEAEKSVLIEEVQSLKDTMEEMATVLAKTLHEYNDLTTQSDLKHQKAEETISQLETAKSELNEEVVMKIMTEMLAGFEDKSDDVEESRREQKAPHILTAENKELKKTLADQEELLKGLMIKAEETQQKNVENVAEIKAYLTLEMHKLQADLMNICSETQPECDQEHDILLSFMETDNPEELTT